MFHINENLTLSEAATSKDFIDERNDLQLFSSAGTGGCMQFYQMCFIHSYFKRSLAQKFNSTRDRGTPCLQSLNRVFYEKGMVSAYFRVNETQ